MSPDASESERRRGWLGAPGSRLAWRILVITLQLMLITAMQNQNVSELIYRGF